ncbi:hypothetical protein KUTeg_013928 [Tegillarca granosa]|uniref:ADF-H domain-containing protein n=1 Tax=Tegillarca granosa TaxID=220873 RepID=A0ABQ9EV49_TEGGR|nr:hypothetical protein KUTeg_013928 [Tegillarca granosa]
MPLIAGASGVAVLDECVEAFQEIKLGHKWQYIIYRLSEDLKKIIVDEKGQLGKTFDDFVNKLLEAEQKGQCRYGVFDVKFTHNDMQREKLALFAWNPDNAPIKQKMLYTSSLKALKNKLKGFHVEIQCNDHEDLALSHVLEKCQDKYQ